MSKFCPECGKENLDSTNFCEKCGAAIPNLNNGNKRVVYLYGPLF